MLYVHEQIKLDIPINCRKELKDTESDMYLQTIVKQYVEVRINSTQSS